VNASVRWGFPCDGRSLCDQLSLVLGKAGEDAGEHPSDARARVNAFAERLDINADHRDDMVSERTRVLNRLHRLIRKLVPGGANRQLSTTQASEILRTVRPITTADTYRKQLAKDLLDSLRKLDTRVKR